MPYFLLFEFKENREKKNNLRGCVTTKRHIWEVAWPPKGNLRGCVTCREHVLPRDEHSATECLCTEGHMSSDSYSRDLSSKTHRNNPEKDKSPSPPRRPASVYHYPPPLVRGEDTLAGSGRGSILCKTSDTALYSTYVSTLCPCLSPCRRADWRKRPGRGRRRQPLALRRTQIVPGFDRSPLRRGFHQ